jgi:branched-chain amino acid transport system substrate-binding protein
MVTAKTRVVWLYLGVFLIGLSLGAQSLIAAEKPPIKVGLLLPYTGPAPFQAKGINDGVELYMDEIGKKAGGRAIQLIKEDTEFNPSVALTKVRKLVEEHKASFIVGPVSSAVALAIHDYIRKQNTVLINPCASARELTSPEKWGENIFRLVETSDQGNYPMGKWMIQNTKHRNVVLAGPDFTAGYDNARAFKASFEQAGGKVIKEVYPKLGTMDFASYLAGMDVQGADAVYAWFVGTDAVRFVQQYQEFGLKKRLPLFGGVTISDDPYLESIGEPAVGVVTQSHYSPQLDNPKNRAFVKAFRSKYGSNPTHYTEYGYVAGNLIGVAIEAVKGEVDDASRVAKELKRAANQIDSPTGVLSFDAYNQRTFTMYVMKTERRDGKLANVIVGSLGKVAQEDVWKWWRK